MGGGHLAGGVERRRLDAEHDLAHVGLAAARQEAQQPVARPDAEQQHPGGIGVEGAGVADLARAEQAPALGHHVVAGPARRLVDHHQPVGPRCAAHAPHQPPTPTPTPRNGVDPGRLAARIYAISGWWGEGGSRQVGVVGVGGGVDGGDGGLAAEAAEHLFDAEQASRRTPSGSNRSSGVRLNCV